MTLLQKAIDFAKEKHKNQIRKFSGLPFYTHCEAVLNLVRQHTNDEDLLCASVTHDTIEDCGVTPEELEKLFNRNIAYLVVELTNVYTKEAYPSWQRKHRKRKEEKRISKISKEAKLVKLADRIHNIQSFIQDSPKWGPSHYYWNESRTLAQVLSGLYPTLDDMINDLLSSKHFKK